MASAYLLTVPFPYLAVQALEIRLDYEQIGFWLVELYSAPLWLISEAFHQLSMTILVCIYWALTVSLVGAWAYWKRRRADAGL